MKPEKEMVWLVRLLNIQKKGVTPRSKTEYEKLVGAPKNDRTFHQWFKELIERGAISQGDNITTELGHNIEGWLPVYYKLRQRLLKIKEYDDVYTYINGRTWAFGAAK
jgi:hypothetical protein